MDLRRGSAQPQLVLLKIPHQLREQWKTRPDGDVIGHWVDQDTLMVDGKKYDLRIREIQDPVTHLFSETPAGKHAWEGKIERSGMVMPVMDQDYRNLVRSRHEQAQSKGRSTLVGSPSIAQQRRTRTIEFSGLKRVRPKPGEVPDKRERMPKDELVDVIFRAFEQKPLWDLRGLLQHTQQPVPWLKEHLSELCMFHERGSNRNLYQLKPEYRKHSPSSSADSAIEPQQPVQKRRV